MTLSSASQPLSARSTPSIFSSRFFFSLGILRPGMPPYCVQKLLSPGNVQSNTSLVTRIICVFSQLTALALERFVLALTARVQALQLPSEEERERPGMSAEHSNTSSSSSSGEKRTSTPPASPSKRGRGGRGRGRGRRG